MPQVIGRAPDNEIVVPSDHVAVSRRHLQIRVPQDAILIQDLGSTGGTRLNGVDLAPNREVEVVFGDRIALAGLELVVVAPDAKILRQRPASRREVGYNSQSSIIFVGRGRDKTEEAELLRTLSPAEIQILCWISRGLTTFEEVAAKLFRSPHTIRTQINSIYRKLDVHSREELLAWLTRNEFSWATPTAEDRDESSIHSDDSDVNLDGARATTD